MPDNDAVRGISNSDVEQELIKLRELRSEFLMLVSGIFPGTKLADLKEMLDQLLEELCEADRPKLCSVTRTIQEGSDVGNLKKKLEAVSANLILQDRAYHTAVQKKVLGENEKLTSAIAALTEFNQKLVKQLEEFDKLRETPFLHYGILQGFHENGSAIMVLQNGTKTTLPIHPNVQREDLRIGCEVEYIQTEAFTGVVGPSQSEVVGIQRVSIREMVDERHAVVSRGSLDEEAIVTLSDKALADLAGVLPKSGDKALVDFRSTSVLRVELHPEMKDFLLEEVPDVTYEQIGGLASKIEQLRDAVELPFLHTELFGKHKLSPPKGVLLYGPPGCGKTLLAKAVASSVARQQLGSKRAYFMNIKGPELLNKYVGESERKIRDIFSRAKQRANDGAVVVIFFDEAESLLRQRGSGISSDMESTIVPQFLVELDGVEGLRNVIIVLASNRHDLIDPAVLRNGRIDVIIEVTRPDILGAYDIVLKYLTPDLPLHPNVRDVSRKTVINRLREHAPKDWQKLFESGLNQCPARGQIVNESGAHETWRIETAEEKVRFMAYRFVEDLYFKNSGGEAAWTSAAGREIRVDNRCAEVHSQKGSEMIYIADITSGASLEGMVSVAKRRSIKRSIATGGKEEGVSIEDFYEAKREQMASLAVNTMNPDDWAKIIGRAGGGNVFVTTFSNQALLFMRGRQAAPVPRKVEEIRTGHYL